MNTHLYARLSPAERHRLCEVLRWARANGFHVRKRAHRGQHAGLAWFHHSGGRSGVIIMDRYTLTAYRFGAPADRVQLTLPRSLTQVLSVLAAMEYLPARFAEAGADALREHARTCSRYADDLLTHRHDPLTVMRIFYAAGLYRAARVAAEVTG